MIPLRCHLLIGQPASGKTTLAQALAPLLTEPGEPPAVVLSTDAMRAEVFGDAAVQGPRVDIQQHLHHRIQEMAAGLAETHFGPSRAEGFAALCAVVPTHHNDLVPVLQAELAALDRRIRSAINRERKLQRHGYSRHGVHGGSPTAG